MTNLRILHTGDDCGIDDDSLVSTFGGLNLIQLNAYDFPKNKTLYKKLP